jgi:hypothetical protein
MATYSSRKEVKEALQDARKTLKEARKVYGKESDEAKEALKECMNLQYILDRM